MYEMMKKMKDGKGMKNMMKNFNIKDLNAKDLKGLMK